MTTSSDPHSELPIIARCVELALAGIGREYPNHVSLVMTADEDARPPRDLTPIFYGCFDWHSAVHSHWTLVRILRLHSGLPQADTARGALASAFTTDKVAHEVAYIGAPHRSGFERPYGLAWLLQLCAELREWQGQGSSEAGAWREALTPLEDLAAGRLRAWLPTLLAPIRSGEHSQTAFALGLVLDWARTAGDDAFAQVIGERARSFFVSDVSAPIAYEPSGYDFVSPVLGEADLMRRILEPGEFGDWLDRFLPSPESEAVLTWLTPVVSPDPADGKQSHLEGLNLSRASMLEGIVSALPETHPWARVLRPAAERHAAAGLESLSGDHYAGTHWLGSFATYLLTRRGIGDARH